MLEATTEQQRRRKRHALTFRRRLYTRTDIAAGRMLLRRLLLVAGLICLVFAVFWLDRGGLRDQHDGHVSLVDVIYFTFVTVTTVGYGDIVPITDRARLIDAFLVTPIRLFVLVLFVGTAYELVIQRALEDLKMRRLQKNLGGHIVICGFGMVGRSAAEELISRGADPASIVAIDPSAERLEAAAERGLLGLRGDATEPDLLTDVAIAKARAALVCTARDDTNTLVCLAIRACAPDVRIVVSVRNPRQMQLLAASGATSVISPSGIGGRLMANALSDESVAQVVADLISARGNVVLKRRFAEGYEVGRSPRSIGQNVVLALCRGGALHWTWDSAADLIQPGDELLVVEPAAAQAAPAGRA